jgi:cytochrome P450
MRHAPLSSTQRLPRFFPQPEFQRGDYSDLFNHMTSWLLLRDPPEHTRLRKLMNPAFTPVATERLRPQVQASVEELLDRMQDLPEPDLLRDLAYPLPARVISRLLGVSEELHDRCVALSDSLAIWVGTPVRSVPMTDRAQDAARELVEIFRSTVKARHAAHGDDLMGMLLAAAVAGEGMTEEMFYAQCVMMLFAGHETTRNLIGNALFTLLREPEVLGELRANGAAVRSTVEEVLRFESPVQGFGRHVLEDTAFQGEAIPAGTSLIFLIGAAHRDPRQFEDPNRFDIHRLHNRHLAFGGDAHSCLGSTLARLEGQIAIQEVVRRYPGLRLEGSPPQWSPNFALRGLTSLRVALA